MEQSFAPGLDYAALVRIASIWHQFAAPLAVDLHARTSTTSQFRNSGCPSTTSPAPAVRSQARYANAAQSNLDHGVLVLPREIPHNIRMIAEEVAPPQVNLDDMGVPGGTGDPRSHGIINSIGNSIAAAIPPPPAPHPLRVSRMMEGNLIHKVQPEYPVAAKAARIQGAVVLRALISKDGGIENLRVLGGHPMLVKAAMDAVSQWRYRPYYLNGEPVEVETQVTVNFVLAGG